jgi:hypothetical protein
VSHEPQVGDLIHAGERAHGEVRCLHAWCVDRPTAIELQWARLDEVDDIDRSVERERPS